MAMCNGISHVGLHEKSLQEKDKSMSKLPKAIKDRLKKESREWDAAIAGETPEETEALIEQAQPFVASRPPRRPVSVRMDSFDLAMLKRLARKKGLPPSQLMAMWLHERIEQEKREQKG
jgi:predicted DNA binding CopG/RHH family protein